MIHIFIKLEVFDMLTVQYYDTLMASAPTPEWAKAERYDYCDQTVRKIGKIHSLSAFFTWLFE